jgi:hypothetical protein
MSAASKACQQHTFRFLHYVLCRIRGLVTKLVYMYIYVYVYVCVYTYIFVQCRIGWLLTKLVYIWIYMYVCICICIYVYAYVYIYTHTHAHTHTLCICTYIQCRIRRLITTHFYFSSYEGEGNARTCLREELKNEKRNVRTCLPEGLRPIIFLTNASSPSSLRCRPAQRFG